MNVLILILIVLLILLYAVAQVMPIGGIIVFVVLNGFLLWLNVHTRLKRKRKEQPPDEKDL